MDFKDNIKQLSERVIKLKDSIQTEEATKNAFIMPFINALGYDGKHSKKCTFYTLRFGCSFAAVNTIKPQLL